MRRFDDSLLVEALHHHFYSSSPLSVFTIAKSLFNIFDTSQMESLLTSFPAVNISSSSNPKLYKTFPLQEKPRSLSFPSNVKVNSPTRKNILTDLYIHRASSINHEKSNTSKMPSPSPSPPSLSNCKPTIPSPNQLPQDHLTPQPQPNSPPHPHPDGSFPPSHFNAAVLHALQTPLSHETLHSGNTGESAYSCEIVWRRK